MRIQHVGLVVSDLERARRFYGEALGLAEVPRPPNFAFAGAWFECGDDQIHLLAEGDTTSRAGGPEPGPGAELGLAHHLAFEVDDLEAACVRLDEHGAALFGGPMPRGDGVTQVFVLDPDSHIVELFQWTGEDQSEAPTRAPVRG